MLARSALRSARSVPVATHARAFSSGEFFPGIPKIQVRAQTQPSTFAGSVRSVFGQADCVPLLLRRCADPRPPVARAV